MFGFVFYIFIIKAFTQKNKVSQCKTIVHLSLKSIEFFFFCRNSIFLIFF